MASEYLEGDPRADDDRFLFEDLSPYVAQVHQETKLIADLIRAGRYEEAEQCALSEHVKAKMLLQRLEVWTLPEVDVESTRNALPEPLGKRVYKGG